MFKGAAIGRPFQYIENLCGTKSVRVWAGELEGAAARLEWDRMPRKPCCARLPARGARTFALLCSAKVTAFLQAVGKVPGLFRQPAGRPVGRPAFCALKMLFCCPPCFPPALQGGEKGQQPRPGLRLIQVQSVGPVPLR